MDVNMSSAISLDTGDLGMVSKPLAEIGRLPNVNGRPFSGACFLSKDVISGDFFEGMAKRINPVGIDRAGLSGPIDCLGCHGGGSFL